MPHSIDIMRSGSLLATIKPDDSSTQVKRIMGENVLSISFTDSRFIPFQIGDYCTVFGEIYKINQAPTDTKKSNLFWEYSLRMESEASDLAKAAYLFYGTDNTLTEPNFSLMGNLETFVDHALKNIERVDTGWTKGELIPTVYKPLTFNGENCYNALIQVAQEFGVELWVEGKKISMTKVQRDTGRLFGQGQNKGLYEILRRNMDASNIATRFYVFGSNKNLPPSYGSNCLRLPGVITSGSDYRVQNVAWNVQDNGNGTQTISFSFVPPTGNNIVTLGIFYSGPGISSSSHSGNFSPRTITVPVGDHYDIEFVTYLQDGTSYRADKFQVTNGSGIGLDTPGARVPYLEKNTSQYGVIESVQVFDDIYPHRTGKVTDVDPANFFRFYDTTIDFNLNFFLLPGVSAKITFNTGQLAGYTFDLTKYEHGPRAMTILKNKDEKALDVPNALMKPAVGDEYVLVDIIMPPEYVEKAEAELMVKAQALLEVVSVPQLSYSIAFDPTYLPKRGYIPAIGDLIWIKDEQLSVNRKIRITSTTRNIVNDWEFQVELADVITPGRIDRITATGAGNSRDIATIENFLGNRDVLNGKMQLPTITDTTGYSQVWINKDTGQLARLV